MHHPGDPYVKESLREFGETIFAEMSALAVRTGAINLGQGFPDTDGPPEIAEAAIAAIRAGHNQYPPGPGIPELRRAVARHQHDFYGLDYDPDTEVLITAGATEAIAGTLLAICGTGDEVVTFEPYYDSYAATIAMSGACRRVVTLRAPDYSFDPDELRAAIGPATKAILVNSPHNPTGKVFSVDELTCIAELCIEHDLIAITDEVYEHLVFEGAHVPLATLPGMRERTVVISSAGKTFSYTGWKIGWICAPPALLAAARTAKQYLTYVNGAPFQYAIAAALELPRSYYDDFLADMATKRERLCCGLEAAGFVTYWPQGTYFVTADITPFGTDDGRQFCLELPERCGVVAVPNVVFYDDETAGAHLIRFTFCKQLSVLDAAVERLATLEPRP
ncbi:MAG: pyridoxal phosphate-dependent aminotransferase [Acidimicrobiales bacterium]